MKTLTITFALSILITFAFAQEKTNFSKIPKLIAAGEYLSYEVYYGDSHDYIEIDGERFDFATYGQLDFLGLSRYMFDGDDEIEFLYVGNSGIHVKNGDNIGQDTGERDPLFCQCNIYGIKQGAAGAIISIVPDQGENIYTQYTYAPLPGNTPEFDNMAAALQRTTAPPSTPRVDTVYIENTITRVDSVFVTERIYVEGNIDTVYNEVRVTETIATSDTVYNFVSRVDSVYLLGGDYLDDLNRVTSVENQLEVEKLGNPYPNPASGAVSIDYVATVPTNNMFLGVYDNQGRRVEQFPVKPSHTITFDVSDWAPGVYVYMIWSPVGVSTTKRLIVI